jgi:hypothetical protein
MLLALLAAAQKLDIALEGAEVRAGRQMHLDLKTGTTRASHFVLDLYVQADIDEEQRARLEALARDGCAARATFLGKPEIVERLHVGVPTA